MLKLLNAIISSFKAFLEENFLSEIKTQKSADVTAKVDLKKSNPKEYYASSSLSFKDLSRNSQKLKIQEHINTMKYIIDKLDEINENDNEVEAFMYRGDEKSKLLTKLFDSIRALMRANARNRLNEANKQERDFNELLREIGRLKYEIEIGEPNREFKEQIVLALKHFNHNTLAKITDIEPIYNVRKLDNYDTKRNVAILINTLDFLRDTCLDVAKR